MADNNNPIKYSDLIQPDDSITKLIKQLDELSDAYMNTLGNILNEAKAVRASLEKVSGATANGQKTVKKAAQETDVLTKAYQDAMKASTDAAKQLANYKLELQQQNTINKLTAKLNNSIAGSYDHLSAQYSLNKITLNGMESEVRDNTDAGRELVRQTAEIYEEMKRLQSETGKTSLNVGNYEQANVKLTSQVRILTEQLAVMRMEGKQGTAEYAALSEKAGSLRDALHDATQEVKNMASDTSKLDTVMSAASAAGGGFAAYTGAMELFGGNSEDVQEAQKKLQASIAITSGLQAVQNALQKQSALMLGIGKVQIMALAKAEAYRRLVQLQGSKATVGATVAQKAFNLIASANPYVLLALALITVVGALVMFSSRTGDAGKQQSRLNELQKLYIESLELESNKLREVSNLRIEALQREMKEAQARNASQKDIRKIEDQILAERRRANAEQRGFYAQEIEDLDENRSKLDGYRQALIKLNELKANGSKIVEWDVKLDGNIDRYKIDEAIEIAQSNIDNYGRKVELATDINKEGLDLNSEQKELEARRIEEEKQTLRSELELIRKAQDARNALILNSYEKERTIAKANTSRSIADLQYELNNNKNLTVKGRAALNDTIVSLRAQLENSLLEIDRKEAADILAQKRRNQDVEIALMDEGAEKSRAELNSNYERQIEDLKIRMETERGLTVQQMEDLTKEQLAIKEQYAKDLAKLNDQITLDQLQKEAERTQLQLDAVREGSEEEISLRLKLLNQQRNIELAQNRMLATDKQQDAKDINAKYDAQLLAEESNLNRDRALTLFDQQQALEKSEFDLRKNSEGRKTRFALFQEKARLQKILELNQKSGIKMTDEEVATIQNRISKLDQEMNKSSRDERGQDIYGLLGLNLTEEQKEAIDKSMEFALDQVTALVDARAAAADKAVEDTGKEVEASQKRLDAEIEARNNGYANNVLQAQKELDLAKRNQEKALQEQRRAQKQQRQIQTLEQIGNLVTATSKIWAQLGFWGALPAIAVMWGSFAFSKIKANQMTKQSESYGDGTVELLAGGSHQSGNDVDLGTKPDGTRRRAEGGEYFAVINKRNSRRYGGLIPKLVNSINAGQLHELLNRYNTDGVNININESNNAIDELKEDIRDIRDSLKNRVVNAGNKVIYYSGNYTKIVKNE